MPDSETERCKMCIGKGFCSHTGNTSSGTIFAPEQNRSAPLLK